MKISISNNKCNCVEVEKSFEEAKEAIVNYQKEALVNKCKAQEWLLENLKRLNKLLDDQNKVNGGCEL